MLWAINNARRRPANARCAVRDRLGPARPKALDLEHRDRADDDRQCEPEPQRCVDPGDRALECSACRRSADGSVGAPSAGDHWSEEDCHDEDARNAEPQHRGNARTTPGHGPIKPDDHSLLEGGTLRSQPRRRATTPCPPACVQCPIRDHGRDEVQCALNSSVR